MKKTLLFFLTAMLLLTFVVGCDAQSDPDLPLTFQNDSRVYVYDAYAMESCLENIIDLEVSWEADPQYSLNVAMKINGFPYTLNYIAPVDNNVEKTMDTDAVISALNDFVDAHIKDGCERESVEIKSDALMCINKNIFYRCEAVVSWKDSGVHKDCPYVFLIDIPDPQSPFLPDV